MKDTWYGDQRDIVKWGTLAHIAERESIQAIVQVPFLRYGTRHVLQTDKGRTTIPTEIWGFFRDVSAIKSLGERLGLQISVMIEPFEDSNRETYRETISLALRQLSQRKIVLLDPDTGIAPNKAKAEHATVADVQAAWQALRDNDWLVIYQHAYRRKDWVEDSRKRFAAACGVREVELFRSPELAWDVVFFAVEKP